MPTITETVSLTVIICGHTGCGVRHALDDDYIAARRRDHVTWYCPNGHPRYYPEKSDIELAREAAQRAKDEATRLRAALDQRDEAMRRASTEREGLKRQVTARKAATTRLRNKIAKGRCPCCTKLFKDVKAHMASEHPRWNPEREAEARAAKAEA